MDAKADKPIIRDVRLRQGEATKLEVDEHTTQLPTCDDIARLALALYNLSYFFSLRRGLSIRFIRDLNGSGTQGLYITRKSEEKASPIIQVIFRHTYNRDGEFLYEADLIMDRRKDYEPTVNKGKHRFVAERAHMQIEWDSDEIREWRSDIDRLSTRLPATLTGWLDADLEMLVRCGGDFCSGSAILTRTDLSRHVAAGLSIDDFRARLRCSTCGNRGARVLAL